jgi:hypothetical protein
MRALIRRLLRMDKQETESREVEDEVNHLERERRNDERLRDVLDAIVRSRGTR